MHTSVWYLLVILAASHLAGCSSGQALLEVSKVSGYDKAAAEHIIFLNLKIIDQGKGSNEKVKLMTATAGNGKMKNIRAAVEYPYQIKVLPRYSTSHLELETVFEHPLYRSVEVPNQDGTMSRSVVNSKEGLISLRFQEESTLDRIEIYSVTPERGSVKIYTLNLKR
jgi:hypothetical protein